MKRLFLFLALVFATQIAHAELRIDITRGNVNPLPIALPDLSGEGKLGADIMRVISDDLERSGLFKPLDPRAFIENIKDPNQIPRFPDWQGINAQALVTGEVKRTANGLEVQFRLWDVLAEKQVAGKSYTTPEDNWRRVGHLIADQIYKRLTGEDGYFDSRIVYISESGNFRKRVKRLAIMDQDGANHMFLTDGDDLVLTPRFDPNLQRIIYLSYAGNKPSVHLYDLETGRVELLGNFDGMSFAPRFSPDGKRIVMTIAKDGNSEIYEMTLNNRQIRRITNNPAIDTSPSYSPDGKYITFNSDRVGSQQLYVMNADGSNVKRISFGDGRYGTPVWSPRGDLIAFTKIKSGKFHIGVMRPDGSGERILTESFLDEGPTWSPNGRVIIFTRQKEGYTKADISRLYSVDLTGYNLREVMTPLDASDPAWSPLLENPCAGGGKC
jgi:TolB protein